MKISLLTGCLLLLITIAFAQDDGRVMKIPVVFHVLYTDTTQYLSRDKIQNEVADANQDFQMINPDVASASPDFKQVIGNPKVQFYLKDVLYVKISNWGLVFRALGNTSYLHQLSPVIDPEKTLNVYTGKLKYRFEAPEGLTPVKDSAGRSLADDAVNLHYIQVGSHTRLLTHEAGHWLGLHHTFDSKQGAADHITDIPLQPGPTDGNCRLCPPTAIDEQASRDPNFIHTNYNNFMDYSGCRVMFSLQQAAKIRYVIMNYRPLIWQNATN